MEGTSKFLTLCTKKGHNSDPLKRKARDIERIELTHEMLKLPAPPGDGVTSLSFSPAADDYLLVSSWDSTTRLYSSTDQGQYTSKFTFDFGGAALTSCYGASTNEGFSGLVSIDSIILYA